jgi:hypothetical protein
MSCAITSEPHRQSAAAAENHSRFRRDPAEFVRHFWPEMLLAPYQAAILESFRDNPETWVQSANEIGKSRVAAIAALWAFFSRRGPVSCCSCR